MAPKADHYMVMSRVMHTRWRDRSGFGTYRTNVSQALRGSQLYCIFIGSGLSHNRLVHTTYYHQLLLYVFYVFHCGLCIVNEIEKKYIPCIQWHDLAYNSLSNAAWFTVFQLRWVRVQVLVSCSAVSVSYYSPYLKVLRFLWAHRDAFRLDDFFSLLRKCVV